MDGPAGHRTPGTFGSPPRAHVRRPLPQNRPPAAGGTAMNPPAPVPPVGSYAVDTHTGKVGMVTAHEGLCVRLRPLGGGREWECPHDTVRRATAAERLSAATAYANARSRGEVP